MVAVVLEATQQPTPDKSSPAYTLGRRVNPRDISLTVDRTCKEQRDLSHLFEMTRRKRW